MIPERLHILIGLRAVLLIVGTAYFSLIILIEGKNKMQLIVGVGIPQFQCIMVASGYVPVQSTQNAFVIINKALTSQLGKETFAEVQFGPCFVHNETAVLVNLRVLSPYTDVLCRDFHLQVGTLVLHREACTVVDETRRLLPFIAGNQSTVTILRAGSDLDRH